MNKEEIEERISYAKSNFTDGGVKIDFGHESVEMV